MAIRQQRNKTTHPEVTIKKHHKLSSIKFYTSKTLTITFLLGTKTACSRVELGSVTFSLSSELSRRPVHAGYHTVTHLLRFKFGRTLFSAALNRHFIFLYEAATDCLIGPLFPDRTGYYRFRPLQGYTRAPKIVSILAEGCSSTAS